MSKKNIVIAGCGFAGLSALAELKKHRAILKDHNLVMIDKKHYFEFLPMLPDVVGGWIKPELLRYDLDVYAKKINATFVEGEIKSMDPVKQLFILNKETIEYEQAVIAPGSETNFYGKEELRDTCFELDDVDDAVSIKKAILLCLEKNKELNVLVIGGGYTGIEIATNINFLLRKNKTKQHVYIVEKSERILVTEPEWVRRKVEEELTKTGIEIITGDSLKENYNGISVLISGKIFNNALCVWTACVQAPEFLSSIEAEKEKTRILSDKEMRIKGQNYNNLFVAGDAAAFKDEPDSKSLRMAVMFSIGQGKAAADNIKNNIEKKQFVQYKHFDLGYLVPMAQGKAYGRVMKIKVSGLIGHIMHYFMCIYRSEWSNKIGLVSSVILRSSSSATKK
ncbi:MAG: FAD-dependent oxidoreductase [Candidatus Omnitrophica bacterium]|nr:FAD-dependent oxidoreductase [Candidatus Omnitrophota bacterium]